MMSYRRLIVVLGASGRQGNQVVRSLLEYPTEWKIRGVTNDLQAMSIHVSVGFGLFNLTFTF